MTVNGFNANYNHYVILYATQVWYKTGDIKLQYLSSDYQTVG